MIWCALLVYEYIFHFHALISNHKGDLEAFVVILAVGILIFYLFHRFIWEKLEGGTSKFGSDHFRLTGFYYLVLIAAIGYYIQLRVLNPALPFSKADIVFVMPILLSFVAIVTNLIYMKRHKRLTVRAIFDFILDWF